ncbi:MAG: hypothetical protein LBR80_14170 [Deltaproteobacteria bacterium]|nr:hypothetical protein [Deltaproteobacteria bacterium]
MTALKHPAPCAHPARLPATALALALLLALPGAARAVPFADTGAPPELERWSNWVLFGQEHYRCPPGPDGYSPVLCVLPVTLSLELTDSGGRFKGVWDVRGGRRTVRLPGDDKAWPRDVSRSGAGGRAAAFNDSSALFKDRVAVGSLNGPVAELEEGVHELTGEWSWSQLPETVTVPLGPFPSVTVNGKPLEFPETDIGWDSGTARIWLGAPRAALSPDETEGGTTEPASAREGDMLDVRVSRLVRDDQPLSVMTRVRVTVSGEPREELVPGLLLPGGRPVSLQSPLPARLTSEGLRLQARPGSYEIFIETRQTGEATSGGAYGTSAGDGGPEAEAGGAGAAPGSGADAGEPGPDAGEPGPNAGVGGVVRLGPVTGIFGQEYWAFQADPILRQAEVAGGVQVDASQADIPWRELPVFALDEGESLTLTTLRRGDPDPGPNLLTLDRACWLDSDGSGLSCRDRVDGQMRRDWRLTADPPFEMGQATLNGEPQVITWQKNSRGEDAPGVQLRRGRVDMTADLRINAFDGGFPASGWDQDITARAAVLNLPPGWKLLSVSGADASGEDGLPAAWRDIWTTLDLFIVLVIVFAAWRLLGLPWAILGAIALALSYQEYLCPRLVFLHLLAAAAILKALPPSGKARAVVMAWRWISAAVLVIACASFVIFQARWAAYPQLEPSSFYGYSTLALGPSSQVQRLTLAGQMSGKYASESYSPYQEDGDYYDKAGDGYAEVLDEAAPSMSMPMAAAAPSPAPMKTDALRPDMRRRQVASARPANLAQLQMSSQNSMQILVTDAKAQNTFPRPSWRWRTVVLDYNGQAAKGQTTELALAGPALNRFLGIMRVILMVWFSLSVLGLRLPAGLPPRLSALFPPRGGRPVKAGEPRGPEAGEPQEPQAGGHEPSGGGGGEGTGAKAPAAAVCLALGIAAALAWAPAAEAQPYDPFPPDSILDSLELRLKELPSAPPPNVPELEIRPGDGTLALAFAVEAPREGFLELPLLDSKIFQPVRATVNGKDAPLLAYNGDHLVLLPQGTGQAIFEGRLKDAGTFQISFGRNARPMRARLAGTGWELRGVDPQGNLTGSAVFLSRTSAPSTAAGDAAGPSPVSASGGNAREGAPDGNSGASAAGAPDGVAGRGAEGSPEGDAGRGAEGDQDGAPEGVAGRESDGLPEGDAEGASDGGLEEASADGADGGIGEVSLAPAVGPEPGGAGSAAPSIMRPFFRVTRTLSFGLEMKVLTSVEPLAPLDAPYTLAVPLVRGESPVAAGLSVMDGTAHLALSPGTPSRSWESALRLPEDGRLELTSSEGPYQEIWILDAATLWRVETEGLPPVLSMSGSGYWNPEWRPAPGDSLSLAVTRPRPVEGGYLVADKADLSVEIGRERRKVTLDFQIRSSQGGNHTFSLPAGAVTEELTLDGRPLPFGTASADGAGPPVTVPLNPGTHALRVSYSLPSPVGLVATTPLTDPGLPVANIETKMSIPMDRWTLLAGGPVRGPAVLFWSQVGAFLVFSFILSSLRLAPLRTLSWTLFFIGISQLSVTASVVCAGWLLALGLRSGRFRDIRTPWRFNFCQLLLVVWTATALYLIYRGLTHGLLESPNMSVNGNGSSDHYLRWFQDRADGPFQKAWALTLPGAVYRLLMLAWALWMAVSVVRWLRWGWKAFSATSLWKRSAKMPREGQRLTPAQRMALSRQQAFQPAPAGPWQAGSWPQGHDAPQAPGVPWVPEGAPGAPQAPGVPWIPEAAPGAPQAPGVPGVPEGAPDAPQAPGVPWVPEGAPDAPHGTAPAPGATKPEGGSGPEGEDPEKP